MPSTEQEGDASNAKMNKRTAFGLFFILLVIFFSIHRPLLHLGEPGPEKPKNQFPWELGCLRGNIPNGATALYFSEVDGSLSWDEEVDGLYFQVQYHLAPGLAVVVRDKPAQFEDYEWFIAHKVGRKTILTLAARYGLEEVKTCDQDTVLRKAGG